MTCECVLNTLNSSTSVPGKTKLAEPLKTVFPPPASISALSVVVPPSSAISSIPALASSPVPQNVTPGKWVAPTGGEKCGLLGKSVGCVSTLQVGSKVTR